MKIKSVILLLALFLVTSCTQMKVVPVNNKTGYFPTSSKAKVIKSVVIDLDQKKELLLAPKQESFTYNMVKNIGYFNTIIDVEGLEKIIIKENLNGRVPSVRDRIGIHNAAQAYKPFLWLRWDSRKEGSKEFTRLVLEDPLSQEEYFICETNIDYVVSGVSDQVNWYPMFNSLIDYIKANSKTYANKNL